MWQPHYDGWWGGASGSWRPCSVAPQWYLWRERKVLLVALVGGSAGNMATLQSHACFLGTAATTITLILKRDPVPEAFSLWCFCADGTLPQVSLMCLCVSLAAMENMLSQRIKLCVKATSCWNITLATNPMKRPKPTMCLSLNISASLPCLSQISLPTSTQWLFQSFQSRHTVFLSRWSCHKYLYFWWC